MIYVATSWRNPHFDGVIDALGQWGIPHYNFRKSGFGWSQVRPNWRLENLNFRNYMEMLTDTRAVTAFDRDFEALTNCDGCILIMPCNRSAHLELGYVLGAGKPGAILMPYFPVKDPELMYRMANFVTTDIDELMKFCSRVESDAVKEGGAR